MRRSAIREKLPNTKCGIGWRVLARLASILLLATACTDLSEYDEEQIRTAMNDSLITTTESWDVRMRMMEDGRQKLTLTGAYATTWNEDDRRETRIQGPVYIQVYDSTGAIEVEAWSSRAVYFAEKREFELIDSVRVQTVQDRRLYSSFLIWSEGDGRITSDSFVTIITPSDSLTGSGFSSNTDLTNYTITDLRGRRVVD
ncbi:MAG: LPS export ABC transporter periplasmic protein LptC [Balneolaceae bacterium]